MQYFVILELEINYLIVSDYIAQIAWNIMNYRER